MNLIKLEVSNWGPHKSRTIDLKAPIVGIIGSNGKGKSFLLQAISYALTGALPLAKEKYIREYDPTDEKHSGKNYKASVELEFSVNGEYGSIKRVISDSSTSRELNWQGQTYKRQTDVDNIMEELLGADKAALQNAVFIRQGELAELVKGTPATRQEIFRRLMNLNFLSARHEEVAAKLRLLDTMNKDVSGELAQIRELLQTKEASLAGLIEACKNFSILSKVRVNLDHEASAISVLETHKASRNSYQDELNTVNTLMAQLKGGRSLEDIDADIQRLQDSYNSTKEMMQVAAERDAANKCIDDYMEAVKHNNEIDKEFDGVSYEHIKQAINYVDSLLAANLSLHYKKGCEENVAASAEEIIEFSDKLKLAEERCKELEKQIDDNEDTQTTICYHLDILEGKRKDTVCLSCKRPLDADHILHIWDDEFANCTVETLPEFLRSKLHKTCKEGVELRETLNVCTSDRNMYSNKLADANTNKRLYAKEAQKHDTEYHAHMALVETYDEDNVVPYKFKYKLDRSNNDFLKEHKQWLHNVGNDFLKAQSEKYAPQHMKNLTDAYVNAVREIALLNVKYPDIPTVEELQKDLDRIGAEMSPLIEIKHKVEAQQERLQSVESRLTKVNESINDVVQYLGKLQEKKLKVGYELGIKANSEAELDNAIKLQYEQAYQAHMQSAGVQNDIDDLKEKEAELEKACQRNEKIIQLQKEMRDLKSLVARDGLPAVYMQEVFLRLTNRVQQLLGVMGANFQVEVDETQPCTFTFTRTDAEREYVMPQEVLSGGQAVRLALALLLASQQIILPDVGLLVLDEPTSHVDQEGVESMRMLFQNLGTLLANAGMQLIVVDHNEDLQTGFIKTNVL